MKTYKFKIYGHDYETKVLRRDDKEIVFSVNGQEYKAYLEPAKRQMVAKPTPKIDRPVAVPDAGIKKTSSPTSSKGAGVIKAPLPGLITKILVKVGDEVKAGQTVCIMEAMKMQNSIAANIDGKIAEVKISEGESVLESQELITIG